MATGSPDFVVRAMLADYKVETEIDWPAMFPLALGPHRDPKAQADAIYKDVCKLKSISGAGRRAIHEERCARVGISVDGVPTFYIGRTKAV